MIISEEDHLAHIGTPRKSGRYPWGSGVTPQRNKSFLDYVDDMSKQGLSETQIAKGMGMKTTELRAKKSIYKSAEKMADIAQAERLKEKAYSNIQIGKLMNRNESSIRALLEPGAKDKAQILLATANMLKKSIGKDTFVQIGVGVENRLKISNDKLKIAVAVLKEEGYVVHSIPVPQLGTGNNQKTLLKVLTPPGTTYSDVKRNMDKIHQVTESSEDGGRHFDPLGIMPPLSISSRRLNIRYAENGGADADGVIYVRPGVKDVSLGAAKYAQVRIMVDKEYYLKGMAMYKDDLPPGIDLQFNTPKSNTVSKVDVMKPVKKNPDGTVDQDNPFGSIVRQLKEGPKDKEHLYSAMNIVNEEVDWEKWSKNLSSQVLSKQTPPLAKEQLGKKLKQTQDDFDEILALTHPTVRKKLLETFAAGADSSAFHLKAAHLPRQSTHAILPINSLKETEVYAPTFEHGERVALIRFPHGGTFEIPELIVNNHHQKAIKILGDATGVIGINHKVAIRLSGADFDGDTVLVIPNPISNPKIRTTPALEGLKNFNAQASYPKYEGMIPMSKGAKGMQMGVISNLITDMTLLGASREELTRAVKHSMVVIDAEKHKLNYKQSALDNNIAALKTRYQGGPRGGASTLLSRRKRDIRVDQRVPRPAKLGGPVDPKTGKLMWVPTNKTYEAVKTTKDPITGKLIYTPTGKIVKRKTVVKQLMETTDAHSMSSGLPMEKIYADHSNNLKALANNARKEAVNSPTVHVDKAAKKAYSKEVESLNHKLDLSAMNAPLERQAQVIANVTVAMKKAANPDMEDSEIKKLNFLALHAARANTGADKKSVIIDITPKEWEAIQAYAIPPSRVSMILNNTDLEKVKKYATPKTTILMDTTKTNRAKAMLAAGRTQGDVAKALGVSLSTLKNSLSGG